MKMWRGENIKVKKEEKKMKRESRKLMGRRRMRGKWGGMGEKVRGKGCGKQRL